MRRASMGFAGHAWVVHHGAVIGQRSDFVSSFVPLVVARTAAPLEGAP